MWYAIVNADSIGLKLKPENGKRICKYGEMIKQACKDQFPVNHPCYDYPGPDILVFTSEEEDSSSSNQKNTLHLNNGSHLRNAVVMSNGELKWNDPVHKRERERNS
jgi:proline racemase